ncbi:MAG: TolC family protein, partial [Desulfobacteraceae bacterium]
MFKTYRILSIITILFICFAIQSTAIAGKKKINLYDSTELDGINILDLKTAQQIAIKDNPSLDAARERVIQAKKQLMQTRGAYFPSVTATGIGRRSIMSDNAYAELPPGADDTTDIYNPGISASLTLFNGFQREYN